MPLPPSCPLLDETLRIVRRRYRIPAMAATLSEVRQASPATALAVAIEMARRAAAHNEGPDIELKHFFMDALARLIHEAMRAEFGDPAFKAMVLRHRAPRVREYASLSAHADQDRRAIHAIVNAFAHPAKQQRLPPGRDREALAHLHASAFSASWSELPDIAWRLFAIPQFAKGSLVERGLTRLLDSPALERLQRLDALTSDECVRRYQSLWDRHGPRPGSTAAVAQGSASQRRGAAAEASAAQALEILAGRLNEAKGSQAAYRVVTSMRVPPSIPASAEHAKSEWDAVLLRQVKSASEPTVWDVRLFVEAKASVDAATTDLPRLLRGLRLLAHAEEHVVYAFKTHQGSVNLSGRSLSMLPTHEADLTSLVLYCCDAPDEAAPRWLSAASRMQLLSAQASLEFAGAVAENQETKPQDLEPVWRQLLESPRWRVVLHQYPMLCQVRELMVHADDLLNAVYGITGDVRANDSIHE